MNKKTKILFLGFLVPDGVYENIINRDNYPPIQTKKFINSFNQIIETIKDFDVDYVSTRPISTYPNNSQVFVKQSIHKFSKNKCIVEIFFVNFPFLKLLTRFFSSFVSLFKHSMNKKYDYILVYSVHLPFLLSSYLISRIFDVKLVSLWTDPPAKYNSGNFFHKICRYIEFKISSKIMKKFDKSIVLSKHLALDFNPKKPFFVLEGILTSSYNNSTFTNRLFDTNEPFVITYTGTISIDYGIPELIKAASMFEDGLVRLDIYGTGPYYETLKNLTLKNVVVHGFVDPALIPSILSNSHLLVNCRSPLDSFTKYSFPSKTFEYFISGTPALLTMLPGIPSHYSNYLITIDDNKPLSIFNAVSDCMSDYTYYSNIARDAFSFVLTKKPEFWSDDLRHFILN
jgi:hypothetical protein